MNDTKRLLIKEFQKLKNIGPAMAGKMVDAGIESVESLHQLGAVQAFDLMYPAGDRYGDFNAAYLLALEGAIRDCAWKDIPECTQQELKGYAQMRQKHKRETAETKKRSG